MSIRRTESRLPIGYNASELGEATKETRTVSISVTKDSLIPNEPLCLKVHAISQLRQPVHSLASYINILGINVTSCYKSTVEWFVHLIAFIIYFISLEITGTRLRHDEHFVSIPGKMNFQSLTSGYFFYVIVHFLASGVVPSHNLRL